MKPQEDKISAILSTPYPETKMSLRSFLGLTSFCRKFIPNASTITASLTDKLKKGSPKLLIWSAQSRQNFDSIICSLSDSPAVKLPYVTKKFVLCTDASGTGVGAVLLQYHNNVPHPVAHASRKLLERETRYSTIERQLLCCLGYSTVQILFAGCNLHS